MNMEIERKFLVVGDQWRDAGQPTFYCQGYLNTDPYRTVRVRIVGSAATLTIKGIARGAARAEFEYSIPLDDARQLLQLCEQPLIEKHRRKISVEDVVWEVDEFAGENRGLVIAEVELVAEDQPLALPAWVGEEVTHDSRYFNSYLVTHPYCSWKS